jgi:hypothetical protein
MSDLGYDEIRIESSSIPLKPPNAGNFELVCDA